MDFVYDIKKDDILRAGGRYQPIQMASLPPVLPEPTHIRILTKRTRKLAEPTSFRVFTEQTRNLAEPTSFRVFTERTSLRILTEQTQEWLWLLLMENLRNNLSNPHLERRRMAQAVNSEEYS